jgi:hypothetical protein
MEFSDNSSKALEALEKRTKHKDIQVILHSEIYKNIHCNENPIYVFTEKELRGLSPDFHIHVSVSNLYTPRIHQQQNK